MPQVGTSFVYWNTGTGTSGTSYYRGGGMKLGPDGNIYVMKTSSVNSSSTLGLITSPNSTSAPSGRYQVNGFPLTVSYSGLQLSTGLTQPALIECNSNIAPVAKNDTTDFCLTTAGLTSKTNVLRNDHDDNVGDSVYLTDAHFVNSADASLATLTVNPADSTVSLNINSITAVTTGKQFLIEYSIKDNGIPASMCNSGYLLVRVTKLEPHIDRNSTIQNTPVVTAVLLNDTATCACTPTVSVFTAPQHGSTYISGDSIVYTPSPATFVGLDSITYSIACGSDYSLAKVYYTVNEKPANISDADCYIEPQEQEWAITMKTNNLGKIYSTTIPAIVADVDNDGLPEILVARPVAGTVTDQGDSVHVVSSSGAVKYRFPVRRLYAQLGAVGRVKMNAAGDMQTLFFTSSDSRGTVARTDLAADSLKLFAYNPLNGNLIWKSNSKYIANMGSQVPAMQLIDIDNDGWTEIVCGNKIFAAESGVLLYSGATNRQSFVYGWSTAALLMHSMASDVLPEYPGNELCYGNVILYNIRITSRLGTAGNTATERLWTPYLSGEGNNGDGAVQIADIDMDGYLDIVHTHVVRNEVTKTNSALYISVYSPYRNMVIAGYKQARVYKHGVPFIGDIDSVRSADGKRYPEIVLLHGGGNSGNSLDTGYDWIKAFKYMPSANFSTLSLFWNISHSDNSGATGLTLFDFNQDGASELVYRDNKNLRIIKGADGSDLLNPSYVFESATCYEYALVADVDNDGEAEIIAVGDTEQSANPLLGYLRVFKAGIKNGEQTHWAPARAVWNQFIYNPLFVRDNLTTPLYPISQAKRFAGDDGILGNSDDVYPFNNYLQQATLLNTNGTPLWITPDAEFQSVAAERFGDSIKVTVCIENTGDAAFGNPIFITFYKDSISAASQIKVDSLEAYLEPGNDTCRLTVLPAFPAFTDLVIRLNDKGYTAGVSHYPWQPECNYSDSVDARTNPALSAYMKKRASMNGVAGNGSYPNPVAVLYNEVIKYDITATNANTAASGTVIIRDTLPAYLDTVSVTVAAPLDSVTIVSGLPTRKALHWSISGMMPYASQTVTFRATPLSGAVASQPLFVNRAWVTVSDTLNVPTDSATYHQGAGVAVVTFAAAAGGSIFNFEPQVVDYRTPPRSESLLIVPDSGYVFAGWSHPAYVSLKGVEVPATEGVFNLDTLLIYGNVELTAVFEPNRDSLSWRETISTLPNLSDSIASSNTIAGKPRIWSSGSEIFVKPATVPSVLRLYTPDGVLIKQQTILTKETTKFKMSAGLYIATLNNGVGTKVVVE
jgi:uncharacterized repeat protein (TIGR01451 family)